MKRSHFVLLAGCSLVCFAACRTQTSQDTVKTTYTHKYGVEVEDEADWRARGASGEIVKKQKDGVVIRQNYLNGVLHGKSSFTYPHRDTIQKLATFDNGVRVDETIYFVSGAPEEKSVFKSEKTVCVTSWYEDGVPRAHEEYVNGQLVQGEYFTPVHEIESWVKDRAGTRTVRDGMGILTARETVVGGDVVMQETYHNNKVPSARTPYVNSKIEGERKTFFANGDPHTVEEWKGGLQNGLMFVYQNGEVVAEIPYQFGKKQGVEKRLANDGALVVEQITWAADQKHGPLTRKIDDKVITEWYTHDKKVSKAQYTKIAEDQPFLPKK